MTRSMKRTQDAGERCDHDVTFPFPFSFFELPATPAPSVMIASLSAAEAAAASNIPGVTASQIRIVLSSEQDANIRSFFGFQATEFTLPSPCPDNTSSNAPESRCHTYTLPSGQRINQILISLEVAKRTLGATRNKVSIHPPETAPDNVSPLLLSRKFASYP